MENKRKRSEPSDDVFCEDKIENNLCCPIQQTMISTSIKNDEIVSISEDSNSSNTIETTTSSSNKSVTSSIGKAAEDDKNDNVGHCNHHFSSKFFLPQDYEPSKVDTIFGRGKKIYNHVGNERLRSIVKSHMGEYILAMDNKRSKSNILTSIIQRVRNTDKGRFVKQDISTSGRWFDVGDFVAKEKISQMFRDYCANNASKDHAAITTKIYRSSSSSRKKRRIQTNYLQKKRKEEYRQGRRMVELQDGSNSCSDLYEPNPILPADSFVDFPNDILHHRIAPRAVSLVDLMIPQPSLNQNIPIENINPFEPNPIVNEWMDSASVLCRIDDMGGNSSNSDVWPIEKESPLFNNMNHNQTQQQQQIPLEQQKRQQGQTKIYDLLLKNMNLAKKKAAIAENNTKTSPTSPLPIFDKAITSPVGTSGCFSSYMEPTIIDGINNNEDSLELEELDVSGLNDHLEITDEENTINTTTQSSSLKELWSLLHQKRIEEKIFPSKTGGAVGRGRNIAINDKALPQVRNTCMARTA